MNVLYYYFLSLPSCIALDIEILHSFEHFKIYIYIYYRHVYIYILSLELAALGVAALPARQVRPILAAPALTSIVLNLSLQNLACFVICVGIDMSYCDKLMLRSFTTMPPTRVAIITMAC